MPNGTAISLQVIGELRVGGLFFRADPGQYELVLTVGGYSAPQSLPARSLGRARVFDGERRWAGVDSSF